MKRNILHLLTLTEALLTTAVAQASDVDPDIKKVNIIF